jgi:hypothetical protein
MPIRDEATRREIEAEFERGLSPRKVGIEWRYGDLHYKVESLDPARIPRANVCWQSVLTVIRTIRGDLLRNSVKLDPWEPPPIQPTQS